MDDDGIAERVRLMAFAESDPSNPTWVFASWRGDRYSFDEGMCYLLWWEGGRSELMTARCDDEEPAVHCQMTHGRRQRQP